MAQHLQFQPEVRGVAEKILATVADGRRRSRSKGDSKLFHVGVHVRRTDFHEFAVRWHSTTGEGDGKLVGAEFFHRGMDYFRRRHQGTVFLVVSDDMVWCKRNLAASDTFMVGGNSPQVDLAIMALCNASIIDYGTFGVWGAVLAGGKTIVSNKTFRDVRWAADYMGWIYI